MPMKRIQPEAKSNKKYIYKEALVNYWIKALLCREKISQDAYLQYSQLIVITN